MTRTTFFSLFILTAVAATQAAAQTSSSRSTADADAPRVSLYVTAGAGGTKDANTKGGALTLGAAVKAGPVLATITGADLLLSSGDTYPYYWESYYGGQGLCRDSETGVFVEESNCSAVKTKYAFSADVQLLVPGTPLAVGAGRRFGPDDHDVWFGTAGVYWESSSKRIFVTAKALFGSSYVSGLATLGVRVTR